jgi:hypothetical protein
MIVNFKVSLRKQNLFPVVKIGERILSEETMTLECCILVNTSWVSISVLNKFQIRSSLEAADVECKMLSYFVTERNCLSVRVLLYISIIRLLTSVVDRSWVVINCDSVDINCAKSDAGGAIGFGCQARGVGEWKVRSRLLNQPRVRAM